jgi:hypothetical protein
MVSVTWGKGVDLTTCVSGHTPLTMRDAVSPLGGRFLPGVEFLQLQKLDAFVGDGYLLRESLVVVQKCASRRLWKV